jgi:hypothetical protein
MTSGAGTETSQQEPGDDTLLCYCTMVTLGELRAACRAGRWPLPGKENTGKLCTGCVGDLLYCLRLCGVDASL